MLLALLNKYIDLTIIGTVYRFRPCITALTLRSDIVFKHPVLDSYVVDLSPVKFDQLKAGTIILQDFILEATEANQQISNDNVTELEPTVHTKKNSNLIWRGFCIEPKQNHGFKRGKRARGIAKRRAKNLVRQTKHRF
jgi:hypothetical protein